MPGTSIAGKLALVTGASSGLGADFARELARRGANLIIVARRTERLNALADELRDKHAIDVTVIGADLSRAASAQDLYDQISADRKTVDILINNAGLGLYGELALIPWTKEQAMLQTDVVTVAGLTKLFLPQMLERRFGYILNMSSLVGFQPTPHYASYSAAKAFVRYHSEALRYELRGSGVSVTVLCPGVTATDFYNVARQEPTAYQRFVMMKSPDVARIGIDAMLARKISVVPGFLNAALAFVAGYSPPVLSIRVAERLMRSKPPQH